MEHENVYVLMMDALDGELTDHGRSELNNHLRMCTDCTREWQALRAIDMLLQQTPALSPAAGFAQRTLARLPNRKVRIYTISAIYVVMLLAGAVPMAIGFWAVNKLGPVLNEPTLVRSVLQSMERVFQVIGTVLSALISGTGEFVIQQPSVIGWLLVMVGVVALWGGVYQQILVPLPQQRQI